MVKVLMLGWEFPPYFAGGVGMVCYELTKEFSNRDDIEVTYVMPYGPENIQNSHVKVLIANNMFKGKIKIRGVPSLLSAYTSSEDYSLKLSKLLNSKNSTSLKQDNTLDLYGKNLLEEVYRFSEIVRLIAMEEDFDIIHAHDWTTYPAAIAASKATGKPYVAHVHITEFDKSGGAGANPMVYEIERQGMLQANKIITVSNFIKESIQQHYGADLNKIAVIHNAKMGMKNQERYDHLEIKKDNYIVLFAGRITLQKGPEYFVEAAKKVLEIIPNVKFIMAGTGDQLPTMISRAISLGIADNFIFHGFYTRDDAEKLFGMADVFVMPSVSEPFGVVPLESMCKKTPTIISKQSGVSEVLTHCLKVDFWDVNEIANKIISILQYKPLKNCLAENGHYEVNKLTWEAPAQKCINLYNELLTAN